MAGQEVPSPPSDGATCSHFPSLSDNMEKFVSLIKRGDCTVESACSQVGVARSTFYRWMHRARDPDAPEEFKIFLAAVDSEKEARRVARNQLSSAPTAGKLSTGTLATICQFLEEGCYTIESACAAAGVGRTSLYRWLEQSRDPSAPQKFKQLAQAVEAARLSSRADRRTFSEKSRASCRSLQSHHLHTGSDTITEQFMETAMAPASWSASAESHLSQYSDLDSLEALEADIITADQLWPPVSHSNFHQLPAFIRHGFISRLNAALLAAFPTRKDVSQMSLVERSRLYFTASQVITAPLNLSEPTSFLWNDRIVCVLFKDFKFLDIPQPPVGAASVAETYVNQYMNQECIKDGGGRQTLPRCDLLSSDLETMSSPAHSESNFDKGAATFFEDLHYHRDGQFEPPAIGSLSPLHASEFQGIFTREDDIQWDFNSDLSSNEIAAEGLGLGLSSPVQSQKCHVESHSMIERAALTPRKFAVPDDVALLQAACAILCMQDVPDLRRKLPFPPRDDQRLRCREEQGTTFANAAMSYILDYLRPYDHLIKGDIFAVYLSRCPLCPLFCRVSDAFPGAIRSCVILDDESIFIKKMTEVAKLNPFFPCIVKDLNELSTRRFVLENPHHFGCVFHFDVDSIADNDEVRWQIDSCIQSLLPDSVGFLFFSHRRFVDFAAHHLSQSICRHSLSGPLEVIPVPLMHTGTDMTRTPDSTQRSRCPNASPSVANAADMIEVTASNKRVVLEKFSDEGLVCVASDAKFRGSDGIRGYWLIMRTCVQQSS